MSRDLRALLPILGGFEHVGGFLAVVSKLLRLGIYECCTRNDLCGP